jgi:hypothetical protein
MIYKTGHILLSLVLIGLLFFTGCGCNDDSLKIPVNVDELSLTDIWSGLVEHTGMQEKDARLRSFRIDTDHNGKVYIGHVGEVFSFYAPDSESAWTNYWIVADEKGKVQVRPSPVENPDNIALTVNPGVLFNEIEKLGGLSEL